MLLGWRSSFPLRFGISSIKQVQNAASTNTSGTHQVADGEEEKHSHSLSSNPCHQQQQTPFMATSESIWHVQANEMYETDITVYLWE